MDLEHKYWTIWGSKCAWIKGVVKSCIKVAKICNKETKRCKKYQIIISWARNNNICNIFYSNACHGCINHEIVVTSALSYLWGYPTTSIEHTVKTFWLSRKLNPRPITMSWLMHPWHDWLWIYCTKSDVRTWNKHSNKKQNYVPSRKCSSKFYNVF